MKILFTFFTFFAFNIITAQTYPGGVSGTLAVWLKAEAGAGWSVASWDNQAPVADRAFASLPKSGSNSSLYSTPSHFNFNRAVQFSSGAYTSSSPTQAITDFYSSAGTAGKATFFAVNNSPGFDLVSNLYSNSTSAPCGLNRCNTGYRASRLDFSNAQLPVTYTSTASNQLSAGQRIDNSSNGIKAFINGIETSGSGSNWDVSGNNDYSFSVGEFPGFFLSTAVPEVIWYKVALTETALNKVQTYLAFKYGITLQTNATTGKNYVASDGSIIWDTTGTGRFRYNIFGIGRDDNSANLHQRISHSVNNSGTTTTAGQHLVVSTNNNFSDNNTAANHPDISTDLQFLTFADNGAEFATFDISSTGGPDDKSFQRSRRVWQAQDKGSMGTLFYEFSGIPANAEPHYVLTADDSALTINRNFIPITVSNGVASTSFDLKNAGSTFFTIARTVTTAAPLPVSLVYFRGKVVVDRVHLSWKTALESNNSGFWVERSRNGEAFEQIDFVSSKAHNGNSETAIEYSYVDNSPFTGKSYYRLKQVDFNGESDYSPVQAATIRQANTVVIYPNPGKNKILLTGLKGNETIRINDVSGRLVKQLRTTSAATEISLTGVSNGIYTVSILDADGGFVIKKLVKL